MSILRNVVIVGASGNLGTPILEALLAEPTLSVTILARPDSKIVSSAPAGVKVVTASFDDHAALVSALSGADALVSNVATMALASQHKLIAAAADAGVKRFIPSEFGSDLNNERTSKLALFAGKMEVRSVLEALAADGKISWTAVSNGLFLDWSLKNGFLVNSKGKKATLFDGGDRAVAGTLLGDVAKAVVGILKHPEETKNKLVYVYSIHFTQKQLVAAYEKVLGITIETTVASTEEMEKLGGEKLARGDFSGFMDQVIRALFGEGYGGNHSGRDSNELLGITPLDEAGLVEVVKASL